MFKFKKIGKPSKGIVKNAQKVLMDNIKFDSKLEAYFYNLLKENKIDFEIKPKYRIMDSFVFHGERIRPIDIIPDYLLTQYKIIVDTKGYQTPESKLKFKLFKRYLVKSQKNYQVVILKTQKECNQFINDLIS